MQAVLYLAGGDHFQDVSSTWRRLTGPGVGCIRDFGMHRLGCEMFHLTPSHIPPALPGRPLPRPSAPRNRYGSSFPMALGKDGETWPQGYRDVPGHAIDHPNILNVPAAG